MTTSTAPISLRPMTPDDREDVQSLWTRRFGGRPSTQENWIDAAVEPTHSVTGFVATTHLGRAVVGFSLLDVGGRDYTHQYLGLDSLPADPPLEARNGLFHLSCVRKDWQECGIGSAFYERRLEELRNREVRRAFGIAWHRPHTVDSRVLFEKWKFTSFATVEQYYARTGGRPRCPDCNGDCICTASLYMRTVEAAQ